MPWFNHSFAVNIAIIVFLTLAVIFNLPRILAFTLAQQEGIERFGAAVRRFKYTKLVPWADKIPFSADFITLSRPLFIELSLASRQWTWLAFSLFCCGCLTDLIDGLKAEAERQRRGQATVHGKYLDPVADMYCFTRLAFVLRGSYPWPIIMGFGLALGARTLLFVCVLIARLSKYWRLRLNSGILPKTITGEVKAAFIALSFGLVLHGPTSSVNLLWAGRLLAAAVVFETLTLAYLVRGAWRGDYAQPELSLIRSPQKTGTE